MPAFVPCPFSAARRRRAPLCRQHQATCNLAPQRSALDDVDPSVKLNAVAAALARNGDTTGAFRVLNEMNTSHIPLTKPTLTSIVDAITPDHNALRILLNLSPLPGYASRTIPTLPSSAPPTDLPLPDPTRGRDLSLAGSFLTLVAAALTAELLEPTVLHHPADEATTLLVLIIAALIFDRYVTRATLWSHISAGLARIFSDDPVRVARIDAAQFLIAYLLGLPWLCFQPDAAQLLRHHADAEEDVKPLPRHSGQTAAVPVKRKRKTSALMIDEKTIEAYLVWLVAGAAAESAMDGLLIDSDLVNARALLRSTRDVAKGERRMGRREMNRRIGVAMASAKEMLKLHQKLHQKLTDGMLQGFSVGDCVAVMVDEFGT